MVGLFAQHELQATLHHEPMAMIRFTCPHCPKKLAKVFMGNVRDVLNRYRDHVEDRHFEELEECGGCGGYHFPDFAGDCREDWERF